MTTKRSFIAILLLFVTLVVSPFVMDSLRANPRQDGEDLQTGKAWVRTATGTVDIHNQGRLYTEVFIRVDGGAASYQALRCAGTDAFTCEAFSPNVADVLNGGNPQDTFVLGPAYRLRLNVTSNSGTVSVWYATHGG